MFGTQNFVDCILDQVKSRGFGKARQDEIIDDFYRIRASLQSQGVIRDGDAIAMGMVFERMVEKTQNRAKQNIARIEAVARAHQAVEQGLTAETAVFFGGKGDRARGQALVGGINAMLTNDPRFKGVRALDTEMQVERGYLLSMLDDVMEKAGKGLLGVQRGVAHFPNIVKEAMGEDTGDVLAKTIAQAYKKVGDIAVDRFNAAGGLMRKLENYGLPQPSNAAKLHGKKDEWIERHLDGWVDWSRTKYADGSPVPEDKRRMYLEEMYETKYQDGVNKLDETAFRGNGRALGNALDRQRLLFYKDSASWMAAHDAYGDGNVMDLIFNHLTHLANATATVRTLGPNPELTLEAAKAFALKKAGEISALAKDAAEGAFKNKVAPAADILMNRNPMEAESPLANTVSTVSNYLVAAQLGQAVLMALGDFGTKRLVQMFHGLNAGGGLGHYLRALTGSAEAKQIAASSGFAWDEAWRSLYATERFTGFNTYGNYLSKRVADVAIRTSGLGPHTRAVKDAARTETMAAFALHRGKEFEDVPFRALLETNGVTKAEWDKFRNGDVFSPRPGVELLRPIDFAEKDDALFRKMQGMIVNASRQMIIEASVEGQVALRGTSRPDTLTGAILHSFAMYKSYPVTFFLTYSRLAMSNESMTGRLGLTAGLLASATLFGALGTQLKEVVNGRDPRPMNEPAFWGKALLAGGALGLYGDFFFNGINELNRTPAAAIGGPLAGLVDDLRTLAFGDAEKIISNGMDWNGHEWKIDDRAARFVQRYNPLATFWPSKLVLDRLVHDRLQELADPLAYRKFRQRANKQRDEIGNAFWWAPGREAPDRAPTFEGIFGQ
jgi:hypothetical protein